MWNDEAAASCAARRWSTARSAARRGSRRARDAASTELPSIGPMIAMTFCCASASTASADGGLVDRGARLDRGDAFAVGRAGGEAEAGDRCSAMRFSSLLPSGTTAPTRPRVAAARRRGADLGLGDRARQADRRAHRHHVLAHLARRARASPARVVDDDEPAADRARSPGPCDRRARRTAARACCDRATRRAPRQRATISALLGRRHARVQLIEDRQRCERLVAGGGRVRERGEELGALVVVLDRALGAGEQPARAGRVALVVLRDAEEQLGARGQARIGVRLDRACASCLSASAKLRALIAAMPA